MCANFQGKQTTLTFLVQICPKMDFGFKNQKTNVEIRISILEIPFVQIFKENRHLWLFRPKFAQKLICRDNVEGVAESWVEAEMSWLELGGGWNELGRGRWSWLRLGGGGWSWAEVGAPFSNTQKNSILVLFWATIHHVTNFT